jgi:hypothetical protein
MGDWNRIAFRMLRIYSPLPLILGLAALVQGWVAGGAVLFVMAIVMYGFGKPRRTDID